MSSPKPTRQQADLADVLELVLDKGIVINADIAITVGETEMIGIELRAAIASFETAAEYGLAFPSGTDMRRVEAASGREPLEGDDEPIDLGIEASSGGAEAGDRSQPAPRKRPAPRTPFDDEPQEADEAGDGGATAGDTGDEAPGADEGAEPDDGTDEGGTAG